MVIRTIGAKGQITIPIEFRRKLGPEPGDKVTFREQDGQFILEPAGSAVLRSAGMLRHLAAGRPTVTIEQMKEAIAAGWANEPFEND